MDQRFHPRYRLSKSVDVGIAYGEHTFVGQLVDFSRGGLQVTLSQTQPDALSRSALEWQFTMAEAHGRGPGQAIRIQPLLSGNTRVGLSVPAANLTVEGQSFQDIVHVLSQDESAGAIRVARQVGDAPRTMEVIGKLHARLARDFTRLLTDGCKTIHLGNCKDIDSGGIGLLAIAHDHGVGYTGATGRVSALLASVDRFRRPPAKRGRNAALETRPSSHTNWRH